MKDATFKLPSLSGREKPISELIIMLLSDEWPLSSKGLFTRIQKQFAKEVTFQGVHKSVKKLHAADILVKVDNNYYKLNHKWLQDIGKFSTKVRKSYKWKDTRLKSLP